MYSGVISIAIYPTVASLGTASRRSHGKDTIHTRYQIARCPWRVYQCLVASRQLRYTFISWKKMTHGVFIDWITVSTCQKQHWFHITWLHRAMGGFLEPSPLLYY